MTTLVDANILLYAYDASSPHHPAARRWPQAEISSGRPERPALATLLALARIAPAIRVFARPMSATADRDFRRFAGIRTTNPLEEKPV